MPQETLVKDNDVPIRSTVSSSLVTAPDAQKSALQSV